MTIIIADDHPIIHATLQLELANLLPQAELLFCSSFPELLELMGTREVNLIVLDIDLPGSENSQMIKLIRERKAGVMILIFSGVDENVYALPYIRAGADGYLSKTAPLAEFSVAVMALINQGKYVSQRVHQLLLYQLGNKQKNLADNPIQTLSKGERKVFDLLLDGQWPKNIAKLLNLKPATISTYKKKIFEKFNVDSISDLVQKVNRLKHM